MSGFSTFLAQAVINHFVRRVSQPVSAGTYLALFVADPTDNNITANELSGAWYARQSIASWSAPTGTGTSTSNSNQVAFDAVTDNAVSVSYWGIYDAPASGNLLFSGPFMSGGSPVVKVLNVDDVFIVNASDFGLDFQ